MWVRGLKPLVLLLATTLKVAPYVGAWIETQKKRRIQRIQKSHPMWVRGLKLKNPLRNDENHGVAPYVGAWIETCHAHITNTKQCRTLCGCVD